MFPSSSKSKSGDHRPRPIREPAQELLRRLAVRKLRIAVVYGGFSSEREISLRSGQAVLGALEEAGFPVRPLDLRQPADLEKLDSSADAVFLALHGKFGEDGRVQALLARKGIPFTGSGPRASRIAMDKLRSKLLLAKAGIATPDFRIVRRGETPKAWHTAVNGLGFPLVVKPRSEGSSLGISIVEDPGELEKAVKLALDFGRVALLEKYVEGAEVTVGILGDEALRPIEIRPEGPFFDFGAKYSDARTEYLLGTSLPEPIRRDARRQALAAHRTLGCEGFSRVDMISGNDGRLWVLELNTIPGMTDRSLFPKAARAEGWNFSGLCAELVRLAILRFLKSRKSSR